MTICFWLIEDIKLGTLWWKTVGSYDELAIKYTTPRLRPVPPYNTAVSCSQNPAHRVGRRHVTVMAELLINIVMCLMPYANAVTNGCHYLHSIS